MSFNIDRVSPRLYGGEVIENEQKYYCYFEEVDSQNIDFWKNYVVTARYLNNLGADLCYSVGTERIEAYPNQYTETFGYNETEYAEVLEFIQKKGYGNTTSFPDGSAGISGMQDAINSYTDKKVFVAYISVFPMKQRHTDSSVNSVQKIFKEVIMSCILITEEDSPSVTHFGIFRNPSNFLDPKEEHKGRSLSVHSRIAAFSLSYFTGKKVMITNPTIPMRKILCQHLKPSEMHIGTNQDLKKDLSPTMRELLEKYPPIYHIDIQTGIHSIAKEGVNLADYPDTLPQEMAEFTGSPNQSFDYSPGVTVGAMKTVIALERLAAFYPYQSNLPKGGQDDSCIIF